MLRSRATRNRLLRTVSIWGLNISKNGGYITSLGSLLLCKIILFFLMLKLIFCISVCAHHLLSFLWATTAKSLGEFFTSHMRYLYTLVRVPSNLLFSKLNGHSSLSLSSYNRCSSHLSAPLLDSLQYVRVSRTEELSTGPSPPDVSYWC